METFRKCENCGGAAFMEVFMVDNMDDKVYQSTVCVLCKFHLMPESDEVKEEIGIE